MPLVTKCQGGENGLTVFDVVGARVMKEFPESAHAQSFNFDNPLVTE